MEGEDLDAGEGQSYTNEFDEVVSDYLPWKCYLQYSLSADVP